MPVRIMFQDEARFGRINDISLCWAQPGVRPVTDQQMIREYVYLYGAFSPIDGGMDSFILPDMYTVTMNVFLEEVSGRHPDEIILMVTDGAPCHRGGKLVTPKNIRLLFLPPYCPQLNPSENMWDEIREKFFGNTSFPSMNELEKHLVKAALYYENSPQTVKSISNWGWMNLRNV